MRGPDELRALVEEYLGELALTPELGGLEEPVRYALAGGGKRIRPVLCLATGEALGRAPEELLPAGAAVELVHTFSLVHDDLPALDDDETRRGRPSVWARYGQGVAVIAGDALLGEAFRLALSYSTPSVARELATATLGMIGGQHLDLSGPGTDVTELNRLKTGQLFGAAVGCALRVAEVPEREQAAWRAFAAEVGLLFQAVDDVLDGDGVVLTHGRDGARALAAEAAVRARAHLAELDADTSVLAELTDEMAARTS
jgi:geranylgeranyl diphosphate synthase type II